MTCTSMLIFTELPLSLLRTHTVYSYLYTCIVDIHSLYPSPFAHTHSQQLFYFSMFSRYPTTLPIYSPVSSLHHSFVLLYRWSSATTDSERGGEYGRVLQLSLGGPHCHQCMVGTQPPGNSTYTAVCVCVSVNVLDCKWGHVFYKPLPGVEDSSVRRVSHYW